MYQQINLSDSSMVGVPGMLPFNLIGLSDEALADLSAAIHPAPDGLAGQGFWPVAVNHPVLDPVAQVVVPPSSFSVDIGSKKVIGIATARDMTILEFAAINPGLVSVTRWRFFQQIALSGLISQQEAIAAAGSGAIPAAMGAIIGKLPAAQQFSVQMLLASAPTFDITHPFVPVFQQAEGMTDAQIIALWRAMAAL